MVKVHGPLMSNRASGKIGERLVFSQRASGQQVRFQRAQKDAITASRTAQRSEYTDAVGFWNNLEDETKMIFQDMAVGQHFTGYNLFIKLNLLGEVFDGDASIYGFRNYGLTIYGKLS